MNSNKKIGQFGGVVEGEKKGGGASRSPGLAIGKPSQSTTLDGNIRTVLDINMKANRSLY